MVEAPRVVKIVCLSGGCVLWEKEGRGAPLYEPLFGCVGYYARGPFSSNMWGERHSVCMKGARPPNFLAEGVRCLKDTQGPVAVYERGMFVPQAP